MFHSIVVGTDGSPTATQAVRRADELAREVDATLHVVSAYPPSSRGAPSEDARSGVEAILADAVATLDDGAQVETHAVEGAPADALLAAAEKAGADLIVVGNKGMTGTKRFLLGSVPNQISHNAQTSVLIVRTT